MQASRLKNSISFGLVLFFAVVLARGIFTFAGSLTLGALIRLVLFPVVVLMVLLFVIQNRGPGWTIPHPRFPSAKSAATFILPSSLLVGILITRFGEVLNLISVSVFILVIVCYFASLYFVIVGKEHYALALLLLSMPLMDFFEWDSGLKGIIVQIGDVPLRLHGAHFYIASLFGVWAATRLIRGEFYLTKMRLYLPVVLLLLYSLVSLLLITYSHNKHVALGTVVTVLVFPLPVFMMMVEAVDTKDKLYLIIYSAIAMVVMYIFVAFYMSYRAGIIGLDLTSVREEYGIIEYGTGSVAAKAMMLTLIVPVLLGLLGTAKGSRQVLSIIGLLVYIAFAQIISFSRSGLLATIAGAACLLFNRRVWFLTVLALIMVLVFWQPIYNTALLRLHEIHSLEDLSLKRLSPSRYASWVAAFGMVREKPILGVGLKNFGDHAQRFANAYYFRKTEDGTYHIVFMHDSHNMFLTVAADLGLVGLGILLWFLGMLLYELVQGLSAVKGRRLAPIGWGLLGVYVAHIVLGVFNYGFWVIKPTLGINVLCWTLFALMAQLRCVGSKMNSGITSEDQ